MSVFGLVVAGPYDEAILETLMRRLRPDLSEVFSRQCQNDPGVTKRLKGLLEDFKHVNAGGAVDKAIVVRDAHKAQLSEIQNALTLHFNPAHYSFSVKFAVVVPEPEAWLLADNEALAAISRERGRPQTFPPTSSSPENLSDPKRELRRRLAQAKVNYTQVVAGKLAELSDLARVAYWCPSFVQFRTAVEDC